MELAIALPAPCEIAPFIAGPLPLVSRARLSQAVPCPPLACDGGGRCPRYDPPRASVPESLAYRCRANFSSCGQPGPCTWDGTCFNRGRKGSIGRWWGGGNSRTADAGEMRPRPGRARIFPHHGLSSREGRAASVGARVPWGLDDLILYRRAMGPPRSLPSFSDSCHSASSLGWTITEGGFTCVDPATQDPSDARASRTIIADCVPNLGPHPAAVAFGVFAGPR